MMTIYDFLADPKPEACPADALRGVKRLEDSILDEIRYARAGIGDDKNNAFLVRPPVIPISAS